MSHEMSLAELFTGEVDDTILGLYGQTLIAIAAADDDYAALEREATLGLGQAMGVSTDVLAEWESFEWRDAKPQELLSTLQPTLTRAGCRRFIYHALRVVTADGTYSIEERDALEIAGQQLDVTREAVHALEALVDMERAVARLQGALL